MGGGDLDHPGVARGIGSAHLVSGERRGDDAGGEAVDPCAACTPGQRGGLDTKSVGPLGHDVRSPGVVDGVVGQFGERREFIDRRVGQLVLDTARIYGNEIGVGRGVSRSGIAREDIFITTKLWTDDFGQAARAIDTGLERLDVDYIDLLLLHHSGPSDEDAYRAMEDAVADGRVRSIGLSNFYEQDFARVMNIATITPAVVQNETHPYHQGRGFSQYLSQFGARLESWYPLGGRGNNRVLFEDPTIADIAGSHGRTPAQILLRWHLQAGNIAIPGSSDSDHIRENIAIFDFALDDDEMRRMSDLERDQRFSTY